MQWIKRRWHVFMARQRLKYTVQWPELTLRQRLIPLPPWVIEFLLHFSFWKWIVPEVLWSWDYIYQSPVFCGSQYIIRGNSHLFNTWDNFWAAKGELVKAVLEGIGCIGIFDLISTKNAMLPVTISVNQMTRGLALPSFYLLGSESLGIPSTQTGVWTLAKMCWLNVHVAKKAFVCKYLWLYLWKG